MDFSGKIINSNYSDTIHMDVAIPRSMHPEFTELLIEKSNSQVTIHKQ